MPTTINFDKKKLDKLKKQRQAAIDRGDETFTFEGKKLHVSYAKYMIEYLESKFGKG